MNIERRITYQRCFTVPKKMLDFFLVHLKFANMAHCYFEMECVFEYVDPKYYDVVVNGFGTVTDEDHKKLETAERAANDARP